MWGIYLVILRMRNELRLKTRRKSPIREGCKNLAINAEGRQRPQYLESENTDGILKSPRHICRGLRVTHGWAQTHWAGRTLGG